MNKGTQGCMYNCGDSCTGECMKPIEVVMNKEEAKDELIKVLYSQVIDLTMMSKIELGDDVISEIKRLKEIINEQPG
jgi:Fe-S-cluster containining protein